jgi:hypothetical protein
MVETPQDELSLRDIVEVLRRHRVYLWAFPLILAALALIYGFLIAEPTYASTATLSVAPVQVQAQLEQRIQVQQATPITFEGLRGPGPLRGDGGGGVGGPAERGQAPHALAGPGRPARD